MIVVGLSHQTAPIEIREKLAIPPKEVTDTLQRIVAIPTVAETVVLSTCNRVEIYAAPRPDARQRQVSDRIVAMLGDLGGRDVVPHLGSRLGNDAVRHLFRVASSLDSLVIGEPQILGQLKEAIRCATEARTLGPELNIAMRSALSVAKRVRTETTIGEGQVSVSSIAVDLARHIFEDLAGKTAVMVGAGEMAEAAAKLLARAGAEVVVVNRSPERAESLATAVGGRPESWDRLKEMLIVADIVVSSTASPRPVITKKMIKSLRRKRRGRSLFLIDIAVPRDVEPTVNDVENVYLYDIDDLSRVVAQTLAERKQEAERAEALVAKETKAFEERLRQQAMKPVIVAMRERTRALLQSELDKSLRGRLKHLGDEDRRALDKMADAALNKILHSPTKHLKRLASHPRSAEYAQLLVELFDLDRAAPVSLPPARSAKEDDERDDEPAETSGPRVAIR